MEKFTKSGIPLKNCIKENPNNLKFNIDTSSYILKWWDKIPTDLKPTIVNNV